MGYNFEAASILVGSHYRPFTLLWPPKVPPFGGTIHSFVFPCLVVFLTSWMNAINPYDSSNHYHPWK
jgi:hypothetical protein